MILALNILLLLPLQTENIYWKNESGSPKVMLFVLVVIVFFVVAFIFINAGKRSGGGGAKGAKSSGLFSGLALRRIAGNLGLDHEQMKMLEYVFKIDEVTDMEKSLQTPALLDRSFRKAYRVIEQTANTEEEAQRKFSVLFSTRNRLENSAPGGLSSTRQLNDDIVLTITNGKEKHSVSVISVAGDNLLADCPKNALGSLIKIPRGTRLSIIFFTKNNKGFAFETHVTGYSTVHGRNVIQLAHTNQLKFLSKRRFRRRQTNIACILHLVYVEGNGKKKRLVVDKRRVSGYVADVSVGGCSIKSKAAIQVGSRIKIEYEQGDGNVAALGQVIRTNRTGMNTILHVKFLRVSRKSMNLINSYVYEYSHE